MNLPPTESTIEELAQYYGDHVEELKAIDSWLYQVKRRLKEAIRDAGPFPTSDGRLLQIVPDGYDWQEDMVAQVMPTLVTHAEARFAGKLPEIERVVEMVTEEFPLMGFEVKRTIDKVAAARVIRQPGEAGLKVAECRTPRGRLGVQ